MKANAQGHAQPTSKLDAEFGRPRFRMKHLVLLISVSTGIFAAAYVKAEIQELMLEDELAAEGDLP